MQPDYFILAIHFLLPAEGGYGDNPNDHGGPTDMGVTQATYDAWRIQEGLPTQSVSLITTAEAIALYRARYWTAAHCDDFGPKVAICVFDWAVNHGVVGAIQTLQAVLSVATDGECGPITIAAVKDMDDAELAGEYLDARAQWYKDDAANDPSQREFLNGWLNRVAALRKYIATIPEPS